MSARSSDIAVNSCLADIWVAGLVPKEALTAAVRHDQPECIEMGVDRSDENLGLGVPDDGLDCPRN